MFDAKLAYLSEEDPTRAASAADGEFDEGGGGGGDEALYNMSRAADVAWTVVFSLMISCAIGGNLAVFWIVLGK